MGPKQQDVNQTKPEDRRTSVRHNSTELGRVMARVLGQCDARILDISRRGVLFESEARLNMGEKVGLRITTTDTSVAVHGTVVRTKLAMVGKSVIYQTALVLDEDLAFIHQLEMGPASAAEEMDFVAVFPHDFSELQRRAARHDDSWGRGV